MALLEAENGELVEPARFGLGYRRLAPFEAPSEPPVGNRRRGDDHGEQHDRAERSHVARAMTDDVASSRASPRSSARASSP